MTELLCFSPAGCGTTEFRTWTEVLPPGLTLRPVRLPGRETLLRTPAHTEMDSLVDWLVGEVELPERFAFYGHSMGAWVAFELAHALRDRELPQPAHLYVAARRAPHLPDPRAPLSVLPEPEFIEALREQYDAIPEALLAKPGILKMFLPTLRADFVLLDGYRCPDRAPLDVPITAFRGLGDDTVERSEAAAWRAHTTAGFTLRQVPGGHFFHREEAELLVDAIRP